MASEHMIQFAIEKMTAKINEMKDKPDEELWQWLNKPSTNLTKCVVEKIRDLIECMAEKIELGQYLQVTSEHAVIDALHALRNRSANGAG
jgi:hypothetical protein